MWDTFSRSWEYAKLSYSLVWRNKSLMIFPVFSTIAALLVTASFMLPLWQSGTAEGWLNAADQQGQVPISAWITLFSYYLASYFVIVFFNSALVTCAMGAIRGERPCVGDGLKMAARRWHAILLWSIVSAVVGVVLRALESYDKIGRIVAALLGTAWTALTYFVVPVIVVEDAGPFKAIKSSVQTLRETWGKALVGNFSLGLISLLIFLPVIIVAGLLVYAGVTAGSFMLTATAIGGGVLMLAIVASLGAAADVVFKTLLYQYATGKDLPAGISTRTFQNAFRPAKT
jgi:hypothetical protein